MRISLVLLCLLLSLSGYAQNTANMRAIQIQEFGDPEVLRVQEVSIPVPGPGELLVRVHAAAVNPVDTSIRAGRAGGLSGASLPYVPGFDVSGTVTAIGSGVDVFEVDDEVFAMVNLRRGGTYAEYVIILENEAALKPARVSHAEAAAIPLVALTAWQALFEVAKLQPGQTILIHAGAGGVGSIAVQLAKWRGARIIATASDYNHDFLRGLGVDVPVDYRTQNFENFASDVDVVLDPIGGDTQVRPLQTLKEGGILVSIVGLTSEGRNPSRNVRATSILVQPNSGQLSEIGGLIQNGIINPIVSYRFPLEQAPLAHEQSQTRRTRGKIVIEID